VLSRGKISLMTEYDTPEKLERAEIKESLSVLSLRRLGYDFQNKNLLLEGEKTDLESLGGYKTGLYDLPTLNDVSQIEGAVIGAAGHVFVARSLLEKTDDLAATDARKLEAITKDVTAVMRRSFDTVYPELLEDREYSDDKLWGFQMSVRDGGIPPHICDVWAVCVLGL